MGLNVLLKILGALKRLAAKVAFVRFERDMGVDVRYNVVALDFGGAAVVPLAREVQVVVADMVFTNMFLT